MEEVAAVHLAEVQILLLIQVLATVKLYHLPVEADIQCMTMAMEL